MRITARMFRRHVPNFGESFERGGKNVAYIFLAVPNPKSERRRKSGRGTNICIIFYLWKTRRVTTPTDERWCMWFSQNSLSIQKKTLKKIFLLGWTLFGQCSVSCEAVRQDVPFPRLDWKKETNRPPEAKPRQRSWLQTAAVAQPCQSISVNPSSFSESWYEQ